MRIIEIILKLAFLALSIFLIVTRNTENHAFMVLILVALLLGLTLIFNKKQSYRYPENWPRMKGVFLIRRIEGVLLVVAAVTMLVVIHS